MTQLPNYLNTYLPNYLNTYLPNYPITFSFCFVAGGAMQETVSLFFCNTINTIICSLQRAKQTHNQCNSFSSQGKVNCFNHPENSMGATCLSAIYLLSSCVYLP
jgi:hypothetical protein